MSYFQYPSLLINNKVCALKVVHSKKCTPSTLHVDWLLRIELFWTNDGIWRTSSFFEDQKKSKLLSGPGERTGERTEFPQKMNLSTNSHLAN